MQIDTSTEFGGRVTRRLNEDGIIWLTTVRASGLPEPSPVWFLWDGSTVLIYSQPNTVKLMDIAANSLVSLNFNCSDGGGDVIIMTGEAQIDESAPPADRSPDYLRKYATRIAGIDSTPERFARGYSVAIRVTPKRLRGH